VTARRSAHQRAMEILDVAGVVMTILFVLLVVFFGGLFL
jgi:hypothetical protein